MGKLQELRTALLDILYATRGADLKIIVGGGYGIYLKREYIKDAGVRTVLEELPEARATNDLDLFLRPELLIETERLKPLAEAIANLGYQVVPSAARYQFVKSPNEPGAIKIDLLTGPRARFEGTGVKADARRAKPPKSKSVGIHAHPVDEATTLEEGLHPILIEGELSSGDGFEAEIWIPHPFTYTMMKLFAFRDRLDDRDKDHGSYHALDLYTILATTTEDEWNRALEMAARCGDSEALGEARRIVAKYFSREIDFGVLRLKESKYFEERLQVKDFMEALQELYSEG